MKKSIFYKLIYICLIALIISGAVSAFILQANYENTRIGELTQLLQTASKATDSKDASYISSITGGNRITVMDMEGNVISDSSIDQPMENHRLRPEVSSAIDGNVGVSKRTSSTINTEMMYIAVNSGSSIYRISLPVSGVDTSFLKLIPAIFAGIALACCVAALLSGGISRSLIAPLVSINENLDHIKRKEYDKVNFAPSKYEEISSITNAIDGVLEELSGYIEDISKQNDKMDFILNNMGQGMVLVDENTNIIHCNRYASMLFKNSTSIVGNSLLSLTGEDKICNRTEECIKSGVSRMFDISIHGGVYSVVIDFINTSWQQKGAFILITDVTEIRSRQKLRQEFVDGVAHDLKNPIASIGENADMLRRGLIKDDEQKKEYLHEIVDESIHMKEVIDDLLILSVLDETKDIADCPAIHVYDICTSVEEKLLPMSREMNLSMKVEGNKDTLVKMKPEHLEKVMTELMTNAIKYNVNGGKVMVTVEQKGEKAKISISNTGPGIDPILIPRLFERFYREEQNRSAKIKGAGLGLAIIKHIISLYEGRISVKCIPDVGTTFTVKI